MVAALVFASGLMDSSSLVVAHNSPKRCGHRAELGAGWFKLRAHRGTRCPKARVLAEKWHDRALSGGGFARRIKAGGRSWRCRTRQLHPEVWKVLCASKTRIVHFQWGF